MPEPWPRRFHDEMVRVARSHEPGVHVKQNVADVGKSESCLTNWMKTADVENGTEPGTIAAQSATEREMRKRIRLLEQNEVLRRVAAYLSHANLPGK